MNKIKKRLMDSRKSKFISSIRFKFILLIFPLFLISSLVEHTLIQTSISRGFRLIETENSNQAMDQVQRAILSEAEDADVFCRDWATWDDTYRFIQDTNPEYVSSNLDPYYVSEIGLRLFLVLDKAGELVWGSGYDPGTGDPISLSNLLPPNSPSYAEIFGISGKSGLDAPNHGYTAAAGEILVYAARPIIKSDSSGPELGTLILAWSLDQGRIDQLNSLTLIPFEIISAEWAISDPGLIGMLEDLNTSRSRSALVSKENLEIYERFDKPGGGELFYVKVIYPRTIIQEGLKTVRFTIIQSATVGLILLVGLWIGGKKIFISPLQELTRQAEEIQLDTDLVRMMNVERSDEIGVLATTFNEMLTRIYSQNAELEDLNRTLEHISHTDALTELSNRRNFDQVFQQELLILKRQRREKEFEGSLSLLICDIDYFKEYNDAHGHQAGDRILAKVAAAIRKSIKRPSDFACRLGGEEFAILLPNTPEAGALHVANRLQRLVKDLGVEHPGSKVSPLLTLSIGIGIAYSKDSVTGKSLFVEADQALYLAKHNGRNRIELAQDRATG